MKILFQINLERDEGPGFVLGQIRRALEDSGHDVIYHFVPVKDALAFDRAASRQVVPCDLLVTGIGGAYYQTKKAHQVGAKVLLTRFSPHHAYTQRVLAPHYKQFHKRVFDEGILERALQEYPLADFHLVLSQQSKRTYIENGVPAERVFVANLGVDSYKFWYRERDLGDTVFRALFVATNAVRKGWGYLWQAWKKAFKDVEDAELVSRSNLEFGTLPKSVRSVQTWLTVDALIDLYHECSITVLPSLEEGFGATVLESMSCGRAPIITDVTGACDVVEDGVNGLIVPAANIDALADALRYCYNNSFAPRVLGQRARETAEEHPWSRFRHDVETAIATIETFIKE